MLRMLALAVAFVVTGWAQPAEAQFYFKSRDLSGPVVTGAEPGMVGPEMPGATPAEYRAALVWNLRAAMNVAALMCDFAPQLRAAPLYNALLKNHDPELDASYAAISGYYMRTNKTRAEGQRAFDQFGTRVYSGFSVVSAQLIFCQNASAAAYDALFAPAGTLGDVAARRMRELRGSTVPWGEQQFAGGYRGPLPLPQLREFANERCWRRNEWQPRRCGDFYAR